MLKLYNKLLRVKAFLDEIAEEFIDAKSVHMIHSASDNAHFLYQVVVTYDNHAFNRLSKLDNPLKTLS